MAKRKAARAAKKAKKAAPKKAAGSARKARSTTVRKAAKKKAAPAKAARKKAKPAKRAAKRKVATKAVARKVAPKKVARKAVPKKAPAPKKVAAKATPKKAVAARPAEVPLPRKAPSLDRARRVVTDDDEVTMSPPSSLDLDRGASSAKSGARALHDKIERHHETSPALTGGDVDADWESAYSTGDEAPGGDNMTPDQDVVDEIGAALGIEYDDDEELQGGAEITERDEHRWDDEDS